MIISKIIGGLGNQMFQYAAGRSLALKEGVPFKIDLSGFVDYKLHNGFELSIFNLRAEIANQNEINQIIGSQSKISKLFRHKLGVIKKSHHIEKDFYFSPSFFQIKQPIYLDGYWQSYKYFQSYESEIRAEFAFISELKELSYKISKQIIGTNSVSIHVRRGDYLSNPKFSSVHGFIGLEYYNKAIQDIKNKISSPYFFVFSDDIYWAKNNLLLDSNVVFVSHNYGLSSFEDMRLMSLCKHNIIANSTFSWWSAWLNTNPDKIVIAPKYWFADQTVVPNYSKFIEDLIPSDWVLI